ncbi:unnamed protein product [Adineta steineri]|uniref:Tetratricopeptide repeat protein 30 n=2 Tax=Adineta steineri TaxID=433720 RepID=A0A818NME9_9BILA|nr:unnamed protein product [Adineta steineri]
MDSDGANMDMTSKIYSLIRDKKYQQAINVLSYQNQSQPRCRPTLSLLAYCYYYSQDFTQAADAYEQLVQISSEIDDYKFAFGQSLYKCGLNDEALRVLNQIEQPSLMNNVRKLQAAICYAKEDTKASQTYIDQCNDDDPDTVINTGCVLYKEGKYDEALKCFTKAQQLTGYNSKVWYNIALCYYELKQYAQAVQHLGAIVEKGIKEYPELSIGMQTEGIDITSVGNTNTLQESILVEAFNLRAAIEFILKNYTAAREALTDMPPRNVNELDPITLHNLAIMNMEEDPSAGFEKLTFLIGTENFPRETFVNLCLLYLKYEYYDFAADLLAENTEMTYKYMEPTTYAFIENKIVQQTAPEEAFKNFDVLAGTLIEQLRRLVKEVQENRRSQKDEQVKKKVQEYDATLEKYVPVLMAQANIYWLQENYAAVEKIFRKSVEFCNDNEIWKLNVAHVLFMQDNKYREAIGFYEPIVKKHEDNLLSVSPIVLANLCVSFIMTSQNEEAEELMRKIEREEDKLPFETPEKKVFHLCIVNLVIGTLYCAKNNYEFGISRVMKSLEPYQKKLGTDTWFYTKRCFLSLFENMARHSVIIRDQVLMEMLHFLSHCESWGRDVKANFVSPLTNKPIHAGKNTVAYEARYLKTLLLDLLKLDG